MISVKQEVRTSHANTPLSPLEEFQQILRESVSKLNYTQSAYELLKEPVRFLSVQIPVRMDNGDIKIFTGYRSQHNDVIGPTKGGIRFHPEVTPDEVKALSGWMSLKCGINDLPYGGGKGGVVCNPRELSFEELERLSRGYVRAISQVVGPTKDIPAPDMYTNSQVMAWMMDEYSRIREFDSPGFITGKPIVLGGSYGRETATAKGVLYTLQLVSELKNIPVDQMKIIIQGFGNVGSYLANFLYEQGAKIIGVSDVLGAIYDERGIDIPYLMGKRDSFGTISNLYRNTITNKELLEKECDVLIPAAIGGQITIENVNRLHADIIIEAANGPVTREASKILQKKGTLIVPDVVANAGGVIVSYFEWCQNNQGYYWDEELVDQRLKEKIQGSFKNVYETSKRYRVDMKAAAYIVGVKKIAEAARFRGWID
ncbi:Glu/Leu/Phe/Val family dehydrogenase [Thalassobacillus devorans]|uniref:Glu/Leu/Phe/Val family dehydrogenase n=1 Tax=Thalassobacillus devorans TaxID=279813 RepID=UPI0004B8FB83|nr:Glu/Leu/Phe/Val dehydrogenase [Thalassobacillus devorans]